MGCGASAQSTPEISGTLIQERQALTNSVSISAKVEEESPAVHASGLLNSDEAAAVLDAAMRPPMQEQTSAAADTPALSPLSAALVSRTGDMAAHTTASAGFFSRAMSCPAPKDLQEEAAEEPQRLDAEDMRLQAMRNLRVQNATKNKMPSYAYEQPSPVRADKFSRSASVPYVKPMESWDIPKVQDQRYSEGAKMSLTSILHNLQSDHPDLAAALDHLQWAAKDLGLEQEHSIARTQSANNSPSKGASGMFTRAMSICGDVVTEEHDDEEEEEMSLEQMKSDMQATSPI